MLRSVLFAGVVLVLVAIRPVVVFAQDGPGFEVEFGTTAVYVFGERGIGFTFAPSWQIPGVILGTHHRIGLRAWHASTDLQYQVGVSDQRDLTGVGVQWTVTVATLGNLGDVYIEIPFQYLRSEIPDVARPGSVTDGPPPEALLGTRTGFTIGAHLGATANFLSWLGLNVALGLDRQTLYEGNRKPLFVLNSSLRLRYP